jgi:N-methylhydantoinase A
VAVARELAIRRVVIPQAPAHFSALGMLLADVRRDYVRTHFAHLADLQLDDLEAMYGELEAEGRAALEALGIAAGRIDFERAADMRYVGQEHAVAVPVPANVAEEAARTSIKRAFDESHQIRFSHSAPEEPAELVSLRLSAIGRIDKPPLPRIEQGEPLPPPAAFRGQRAVTLDGDDHPVSCAVYARESLLAGNVVAGPALVEEAASTTLLGVQDRATVDGFGNLVIDLEA